MQEGKKVMDDLNADETELRAALREYIKVDAARILSDEEEVDDALDQMVESTVNDGLGRRFRWLHGCSAGIPHTKTCALRVS